MRPFTPAVHREDGLAMVTALLVTFVVFMMSVLVIRQAIHNVDASGYDQGRLRSVSAAEAGLNWAYNQLEFTQVYDLWEGTGSTPLTLDVGSGDVEVDVDVTYYEDEDGTEPYDMTSPSAANPPRSIKIVATGLTDAGVQRRMESFAVLNPVYGGLDGAVISNNGLTVTNNFNLSGNDGNDGDIVVESGNFSAPSGIENIRGSIYVPNGTANVGTNAHIYGSVWANGSTTVNHAQALIDGDVKSTTAGTTVTNGTVQGGAYYCTGSAPSATKVLGSRVQTCSLGKPPTFGFPKIVFSETAWVEQGYYIYNVPGTGATQCTNARDYIEGTTSGTYNGGAGVPSDSTGVVVRISGTCTYTNTNNKNVNLGTDLALVTNGSINLANNSTWTGTGGTRDVFFMSPWDGSAALCVSTTQNITISNLNTFTNAEVSVYTVGSASVANNNTFNGQIIGCNASVQGNFTMNYRPVLIPGTDVVGFDQDIAYIREVAA
jgi:hypothetical protein